MRSGLRCPTQVARNLTNLVLDISALQYVYGVSTANAGDTIYVYDEKV